VKKKLKIVVLVDISRGFDRDVLAGITRFNRIYDKFQFFFYTPKYVDEQNQKKIVSRIKSWQPDGILTREIKGFESLLKLNIPLIMFPQTNLYKDHINVWPDNKAIGEMAAGHFISKGYKHFAFLGFKDFQWSQERLQGYMETVKQAGCSVNAFLYDNTTLLWEHLSERLVEWLSALQRPCAIFSANDELNIPLLEAAKQCDARVPDDFSIIGVDNDTMVCEMTSPTLSSIEPEVRQAGFQAALTICQWIETGEKPSGDIVVKPLKIIARNSTMAWSVDDEQVRIALHYIASTAPSEDIGVEDVVRATSLSRRILEKRFQLLVRSSILDEIRKVRIERIKYLLTHSELSLQQIASELNFKSFDNITRYFKQYTGWKPLEYRRQFRKA
jgi:LacI family transcriptional regulator, galactose operon repressor